MYRLPLYFEEKVRKSTFVSESLDFLKAPCLQMTTSSGTNLRPCTMWQTSLYTTPKSNVLSQITSSTPLQASKENAEKTQFRFRFIRFTQANSIAF